MTGVPMSPNCCRPPSCVVIAVGAWRRSFYFLALPGGVVRPDSVTGGKERQDGDTAIPHLPVGLQRVRETKTNLLGYK